MKESAEITLRQIWSRQGVPVHRQDEMIAEIERKASGQYLSNLFKLAEKREEDKS